MRTFKRILKVLAILILVIAAVGFIFFPGKVNVERNIVIDKAPSETFSYVSDLKNWNQWSPWYKKDPNAKYEFENGSTGVGATLKWQSENKNVGTGSMTIAEQKPDSLIRMNLAMGGGTSLGYYRMTPEGEGTNFTWGFEFDAGANPLMRIMGHFMKGMVAEDFDAGLSQLKMNLESMEGKQTYQVEEVTVPALNYMYVSDSANIRNISERLGIDYGLIGQSMSKQRLQYSGAPFAIYYTASDTAWAFDAGIPVDKKGKNDGNVKAGERKEGKAVVVHYFGDYSGTVKAHAQASDYIEQNKKTVIGAPWEEYVTDPGVEKDTAKWQTDVYYPVQ